MDGPRRGYLIAHGAKAPWAPKKIWMFAGAPLIGGLLAVGTPLSVVHIEDLLADEARADLIAAGADASSLDVDFSYRDGTATVAGVDAARRADLEARVDHGLLRSFEVLTGSEGEVLAAAPITAAPAAPTSTAASPSTAPTTAPATTAPATPTVPTTADVARDPIQVTAAVADGRIVLGGRVDSEDTRAALVEQARRVLGAEAVVDEIIVDEAAPSPAPELLAAASDAVASSAAASTARVDVAEGEVRIAAAVDSQEQYEALRGVADRHGDVVVDTAIEASAVVVEAQRVALQAEIDALNEEIQANLQFPSGSWELSGAARSTLDKVTDAMKRYPLPVVEVAGYTDSIGPADDNAELSGERAGAAVAYLTGNGVDTERLAPVGAGESGPVASNATRAGRAANRRVQFTALAQFGGR